MEEEETKGKNHTKQKQIQVHQNKIQNRDKQFIFQILPKIGYLVLCLSFPHCFFFCLSLPSSPYVNRRVMMAAVMMVMVVMMVIVMG